VVVALVSELMVPGAKEAVVVTGAAAVEVEVVAATECGFRLTHRSSGRARDKVLFATAGVRAAQLNR
jgi:hypothetical protein